MRNLQDFPSSDVDVVPPTVNLRALNDTPEQHRHNALVCILHEAVSLNRITIARICSDYPAITHSVALALIEENREFFEQVGQGAYQLREPMRLAACRIIVTEAHRVNGPRRPDPCQEIAQVEVVLAAAESSLSLSATEGQAARMHWYSRAQKQVVLAGKILSFVSNVECREELGARLRRLQSLLAAAAPC